MQHAAADNHACLVYEAASQTHRTGASCCSGSSHQAGAVELFCSLGGSRRLFLLCMAGYGQIRMYAQATSIGILVQF